MHDLMMLLHNCVSHPLMGLLQLFGFERAAEVVHDVTLPPLKLPDGDEIVVIKISDENLEAGQLFTELLTLSSGKVGVVLLKTHDPSESTDRAYWVVSYKPMGSEDWQQAKSESLNEALDLAVKASIDSIAS